MAPKAKKKRQQQRRRGQQQQQQQQHGDEPATTPPPPPPPAPPPPPPPGQELALEVLSLVLERQRHAAREARAAQRRARAREAGMPPHRSEWDMDGWSAEDGEEGAVTGGGWVGEEASRPVVAAAAARPPARPPADVAFVETCASAARACRAWSAVAMRALDRTVIGHDDEPSGWELPFKLAAAGSQVIVQVPKGGGGGQRGGPAAAGGQQQRPRQRQAAGDLLATLRAFEGGVLRALFVRGELEGKRGQLRALGRALGLVGGGGASSSSGSTTTSSNTHGLADVIRGLRAARVDEPGPLAAELARAAASWPATPARSPRPLLASLVHLELGQWRSVWQQQQQQGQQQQGQGQGGGGGGSRYSCFFTRDNLPSLRVLCVHVVADESDCPLDLYPFSAAASSSAPAPVLPPPPPPPPLALTRLRVTSADPCLVCASPYKRWPRGEPLLVSLRSLASLASTLSSLWVDRAPFCANPAPATTTTTTTTPTALPPPPPGPPTSPVFDLSDLLLDHARRTNNAAPPPAHLAPLACLLPGLAPLTRLTALSLAPNVDLSPAPVVTASDADRPLRPMLEARRRGEWQAAARALLAPLSATLVRLEWSWQAAPDRSAAVLPDAVSRLSRLTALDVSCYSLSRAAPVAALTSLRRLVLETMELQRPGEHAPLFGCHLEPLAALEHLRLSEAGACLAPVLRRGLPRLETFVLRKEGGTARGGSLRPPLSVLRAALHRVQQQQQTAAAAAAATTTATAVFLSDSLIDDQPTRVDAAGLRALIRQRERGGDGAGGGGEDSDVDSEDHVQARAEGAAMAAAAAGERAAAAGRELEELV